MTTEEKMEFRSRTARSFRDLSREIRNCRAGGRSIEAVLDAANSCEQSADAYEIGLDYDYRGKEFSQATHRIAFYEDMK
jgi:hypothetical protein